MIQKLFNKESVIESASFVLILTIVEKITSLVRGVIFARTLGPAEYGTYNLALFVIPVIVPLAKLGLPACYERYISQYEKKGEVGDFLKRNYLLTFGAASIFTLISCLFSTQISKMVFASTAYGNIIILSAMTIIPVVLFDNFLASFNGLRIFKMSSLLRLTQICIFTLFGIAFVFFRPQALSVVTANLISFGIAAIIFGFLIWRFILNKEGQNVKIHDSDFNKKMFRYSIWFIVTPIFSALFSYTDRLVLNHYLGLREVGVYTVIVNITQLVFMVGMITGNILMPNMSSLWERGEKERVNLTLNLAIKFTALLILGYSVVFVFFKEEIVSILYGSKYIEGIPLIPLLLLFWMASSLVWLIGIYPLLIEKSYVPSIATILGLLVNVCLNYLLIPVYGIAGAAVATLSSQVLILAGLLFFYRMKQMRITLSTISVCIASFILLLNKFVMGSAFLLLLAVAIKGNFIMTNEEKKLLKHEAKKIYDKFMKKTSLA